MLNNLAIFITEFNFVWVFFKMILDPQFLNCCEYTPALTKWALCCFFCQFQPAPLFPLLCVPLTSFFPHLSSSFSSLVIFSLLHSVVFFFVLFFYIRVTFDPNKRQCAAKSGTGAPSVPPTLSAPSNPAPKTLSKFVFFLSFSILPILLFIIFHFLETCLYKGYLAFAYSNRSPFF